MGGGEAVAPQGSCPTTGLGHWTALGQLLEVRSASLVLSILLQPCQLWLGCSAFPRGFFWCSPHQAPAQNLCCVKSLTVTGELDGNGVLAKMSLVPCMVYCFHLFNAHMSLSKGWKVIYSGPTCWFYVLLVAQKN